MDRSLPKKYKMLICSADKELETEFIHVEFAGLEVTTACESLNLFSAANFMLYYYYCQKGRAHIKIEQTKWRQRGLKPKGTKNSAKPI